MDSYKGEWEKHGRGERGELFCGNLVGLGDCRDLASIERWILDFIRVSQAHYGCVLYFGLEG